MLTALKDILPFFYMVRFFDSEILGNMGQFNKFFVNRILQNLRKELEKIVFLKYQQ